MKKRWIALFFITMFCAISTYASTPQENKIRFYRHEVSVGIGYMFIPCRQWDSYENTICKTFKVGREHSMWDVHCSSGIHLDYYYHMDKHFALGTLAAFTSYNQKEYEWDDGGHCHVAELEIVRYLFCLL